jgi:hypothetical protein
MDRRRFLTALGTAAGAGLLLPACGLLGSGNGVPEGQPALVLRQTSYELLTGEGRRYAFLLVDQDNRPVAADQVDVYVATPDEEVVAGPFEAAYHDDDPDALGTFRTALDLPDPGQYYLIAVHGGEKGMGAVNVLDAADSAFPAPGDPAVPVATPTTDDDRGYAQVCTADPDCGMHEHSLDAALEAGRPVMLLFATPAYCQTAVCAPAVAVADRARRAEDWGDVAWVHAEIYTDEPPNVAPPVEEWNLPSEPWLYAIGRDGRIVERIDGPMVAEDFADLARLLA